MIEEIKTLEEEVKQLKLERDTAIFVARDRLDSIEMIRNQKEIFELRYLKEERENNKLHSIIKEVRKYVEEELSQGGERDIRDLVNGYDILEILDKGEDKE